jgi:hypothetical protein
MSMFLLFYVMVLASLCYPPYTEEKRKQYENQRGKRTLPKAIVSKFEVILFLVVQSLQFSINLYTCSSSLRFSELKESFLTPVRAGGTTAPVHALSIPSGHFL